MVDGAAVLNKVGFIRLYKTHMNSYNIRNIQLVLAYKNGARNELVIKI